MRLHTLHDQRCYAAHLLGAEQLDVTEANRQQVVGGGEPALHRGKSLATRLLVGRLPRPVEKIVEFADLDADDVPSGEHGCRAEERIEIRIDADLDVEDGGGEVAGDESSIKLVRIDKENNLLVIRGAVPGPIGSYVTVMQTNKIRKVGGPAAPTGKKKAGGK